MGVSTQLLLSFKASINPKYNADVPVGVSQFCHIISVVLFSLPLIKKFFFLLYQVIGHINGGERLEMIYFGVTYLCACGQTLVPLTWSCTLYTGM